MLDRWANKWVFFHIFFFLFSRTNGIMISTDKSLWHDPAAWGYAIAAATALSSRFCFSDPETYAGSLVRNGGCPLIRWSWWKWRLILFQWYSQIFLYSLIPLYIPYSLKYIDNVILVNIDIYSDISDISDIPYFFIADSYFQKLSEQDAFIASASDLLWQEKPGTPGDPWGSWTPRADGWP